MDKNGVIALFSCSTAKESEGDQYSFARSLSNLRADCTVFASNGLANGLCGVDRGIGEISFSCRGPLFENSLLKPIDSTPLVFLIGLLVSSLGRCVITNTTTVFRNGMKISERGKKIEEEVCPVSLIKTMRSDFLDLLGPVFRGEISYKQNRADEMLRDFLLKLELSEKKADFLSILQLIEGDFSL